MKEYYDYIVIGGAALLMILVYVAFRVKWFIKVDYPDARENHFRDAPWLRALTRAFKYKEIKEQKQKHDMLLVSLCASASSLASAKGYTQNTEAEISVYDKMIALSKSARELLKLGVPKTEIAGKKEYNKQYNEMIENFYF